MKPNYLSSAMSCTIHKTITNNVYESIN